MRGPERGGLAKAKKKGAKTSTAGGRRWLEGLHGRQEVGVGTGGPEDNEERATVLVRRL